MEQLFRAFHIVMEIVMLAAKPVEQLIDGDRTARVTALENRIRIHIV